MTEITIIRTIAAIALFGALGLIVKALVAPRRRDKFLEEILDSMMEPEPVGSSDRVPHASVALDDALAESLLRHFEQSATSGHVLAALASHGGGMPEPDVASAVNDRLSRLHKRDLPESVIRKVVSILARADLAAVEGGRVELTTAGKRLQALLQVRSPGHSAAPVFVSRSMVAAD